MKSIAWLSCLLVACGAAPAPTTPSARVMVKPVGSAAVVGGPATTIAARAPSDTRVLVHMGGLGAFLGPVLAEQPEMQPILQACEIDPIHDLSDLDAFVDDKTNIRIELGGALDLEKLRCLAGLFGVKSERGAALSIAGFEVGNRAGGGVVIATKAAKEGPGAPTIIAGRFEELVAKGDSALVARIGAQTTPFELVYHHDGGSAPKAVEVVLRLGRERAMAAAARLTSAWRASTLPNVDFRARGEDLVFRLIAGPDLAAPLRAQVVESFKIPSGSMIPTLMVGDHLFVLKDVKTRPPERGEVVIFEDPKGQKFAKRVIGVGGDHLVIDGNSITIGKDRVSSTKKQVFSMPSPMNDEPPIEGTLFDEVIGKHTYSVLLANDAPSGPRVDVTVPPGHVFVMGDNRNNSHDSRMFGTIPESKVIGHVAVVYLAESGGRIDWDRVLTAVE